MVVIGWLALGMPNLEVTSSNLRSERCKQISVANLAEVYDDPELSGTGLDLSLRESKPFTEKLAGRVWGAALFYDVVQLAVLLSDAARWANGYGPWGTSNQKCPPRRNYCRQRITGYTANKKDEGQDRTRLFFRDDTHPPVSCCCNVDVDTTFDEHAGLNETLSRRLTWLVFRC